MLRIPALHWILLLVVIAVGLAARAGFGLPSAGQPMAMPATLTVPLRQAKPVVITPSYAGNAATARRNRNGNFVFDARANGMPLQMVFDTGASVTTLRAEDAERAGINPRTLNFATSVETANGRTFVAPAMIETLTVGDITRHYVPTFVARPGNLAVSLLGQSFMAKIGGYRVVGEELVLQGEP